MATTEKPKNKITIKNVRFSYAHIFEPTAIEEGAVKKYSVCLLIPKKDKAGIAKIEDAIEAAIEKGIKDKIGGKRPKNLKLPLRDGDEDRDDKPEYAGMMFVNCTSQSRPSVFDENLEKIIDPEEFYSGCFGSASVNFYAYDVSGSKGIACGLNGVQKLKEGERLSGGAATEDDFKDDEDLS